MVSESAFALMTEISGELYSSSRVEVSDEWHRSDEGSGQDLRFPL